MKGVRSCASPSGVGGVTAARSSVAEDGEGTYSGKACYHDETWNRIKEHENMVLLHQSCLIHNSFTILKTIFLFFTFLVGYLPPSFPHTQSTAHQVVERHLPAVDRSVRGLHWWRSAPCSELVGCWMFCFSHWCWMSSNWLIICHVFFEELYLWLNEIELTCLIVVSSCVYKCKANKAIKTYGDREFEGT